MRYVYSHHRSSLLLTIYSRQTYCYVCCDGDKHLILCDLCTRVVCRKHLEGLPNAFDISTHIFICMVCHKEQLGKTPYRVSYLSRRLNLALQLISCARLFIIRLPILRIHILGFPHSLDPLRSMRTTPYQRTVTYLTRPLLFCISSSKACRARAYRRISWSSLRRITSIHSMSLNRYTTSPGALMTTQPT